MANSIGRIRRVAGPPFECWTGYLAATIAEKNLAELRTCLRGIFI